MTYSADVAVLLTEHPLLDAIQWFHANFDRDNIKNIRTYLRDVYGIHLYNKPNHSTMIQIVDQEKAVMFKLTWS